MNLKHWKDWALIHGCWQQGCVLIRAYQWLWEDQRNGIMVWSRLPQSAIRLVEWLRWCCLFLERTRILTGIQFTTHFINFLVVRTKRFVGSSINVILTRQTCGQCSSRAAESKCRALEHYFSERICYMFWISKCEEDWDLGRCTFWVLAKRKPPRNGDFRKKRVSPAEKIRVGNWHCAAGFFSQVPIKCIDLDLSLLYILILGTYSKFLCKKNCQALSVCFPQPARALAANLPRQDHVYRTTDESFRFHNTQFDEMRCKLDFSENPRSFDKYPTPGPP